MINFTAGISLVIAQTNLTPDVYAGYFGGSSGEYNIYIAVDSLGYVILAGHTYSTNIPVRAAYQSTNRLGPCDGFIAKFSPDMTELVFSTYLGGTGYDEIKDVAVDEVGNIYVTGLTSSGNYPLSEDALDRSYNGGDFDAFLTQMSPAGELMYSTYLGGSRGDFGLCIAAVDSSRVCIAGSTDSSNFPMESAISVDHKGSNDIFISMFDLTEKSLVFSTYLGGAGADYPGHIAFDKSSNIYLCGSTQSPDFPVTNGFNSTYGGKSDGFLTKLSLRGDAIIYSCLVGGSEDDSLAGLDINDANEVYFVGNSGSPGLMCSQNAFDTEPNGSDIIIGKVSASGDCLLYFSYFGGNNNDMGGKIHLIHNETVAISGMTNSIDFPISENAYDRTLQGFDLFVCVLDTTNKENLYSTYLGGSANEYFFDAAFHNKNRIYLSGISESTDFPVSADAYGKTNRGSTDAVLAGFTFEEIEESGPAAQVDFMRGQSIPTLNSENLAVADLDGDGDMDIFVACSVWNAGRPNRVYLNRGDGTFVDSGQRMGNLNSFAVALADLDNDGDIDAFVANGAYSGGNPNKVWLNDGTGHFTDSGQNLGHNNTGAVALADLDGDGDLDAFAGNHPLWENNRNEGGGQCIWFNDGRGRFTNSGQSLGNAESRSVSLGDIDGDGDLDALIGNYTNYGNKFWLNDGKGFFTDGTQPLGTIESRDAQLADLDGDGDLDAFVTHLSDQNSAACANKVWFNQGDGTYIDSRQRLGVLPTTGVALGDLDLDGDLDAFVINSLWQQTRPDEVWLNDEKGYFTNANLNLGDEESINVALADLDGDGDLDAAVVYPNAVQIFINVFGNDKEI